MYVCIPHACLVSSEARRGYQISETGVTDSCELPSGCWKLKPGPLEEQAVLSILWYSKIILRLSCLSTFPSKYFRYLFALCFSSCPECLGFLLKRHLCLSFGNQDSHEMTKVTRYIIYLAFIICTQNNTSGTYTPRLSVWKHLPFGRQCAGCSVGSSQPSEDTVILQA